MQIGEHLTQVLRVGRNWSRQLYATRRRSFLKHLDERCSPLPGTAYSEPLALSERTGLAVRRGTLHRIASELLVGIPLGRVPLFVSVNEILVILLALPTGEKQISARLARVEPDDRTTPCGERETFGLAT
jgi:hypothetical protein